MQPVQDTIQFDLSAERTVVNDTVKLTAHIACIVTPDMTDGNLNAGIRDMMTKLVSETQGSDGVKKPVVWNFSGTSRTSHASGMEQVTLMATARVHESDNQSMDKRIREVSKEGMTITSIVADTAPPSHMIEAAESDLRIVLLQKATTELDAINNALGGETYRLGEVSFERSSDDDAYANSRGSKAFVMAATYRPPTGGDDSALGNAVKLTMTANITFRKSHTA